MFDDRSRKLRRLGLTLIELLVSVGIIGILMALLLPAVMSVRTRARSLICKNNIRQIALSTIEFHEANHRFPFSGNLKELLPLWGQQQLYDALNDRSPEAVTLLSPSVVLCPEDQPLDSYAMYVNYSMNEGGTIIPRTGLFGGDSLGRLREVTDGLSTTMMISERISAPFNDRISQLNMALAHKRVVRWTCDRVFLHHREDEFLQYVRTIDLKSFVDLQSCLLSGVSLYDHLSPPNSLAFSNGTDTLMGMPYGMTPATSNHVGGVHAARCDASVHFVADTIDAQVWRTLGTINRGDITNQE